MLTVGLFARLEAKPGKEEDVVAFLKQGLQLANQETTTPLWFALRLGPTTFAVFDSFHDEAGRQAHLNGAIAKALMANAPTLLATAPTIERLEVLGAKVSKYRGPELQEIAACSRHGLRCMFKRPTGASHPFTNFWPDMRVGSPQGVRRVAILL